MNSINATLSALHPKRVLDLATGSGAFALRLASELGGYGELVAVDSQPKAIAAATKNLGETRGARVVEADAAALPFEAGSFDLVAVANSLHHFASPSSVLGEALRVLSPGGRLAVLEMHREANDEAAMTHVLLHHWWAAIDSLCGIYHAETLGRAGIHAILDGLGLVETGWIEVAGEDGETGEAYDPLDGELLAEIDGIIASYIEKIPAGAAQATGLTLRGEELKARAHRVGFRSAPSLFFIGTKAR
jgi:SAM-dependent methyltransferase